jgi:hypothetical protein
LIEKPQEKASEGAKLAKVKFNFKRSRNFLEYQGDIS